MLNRGMKAGLLQAKPYLVREEGERFQSLGVLVSVKASTEQTGGGFNLFDVICPIDFATPLHIHYAEDVAVFVIEGAIRCFWGDEKERAGIGSLFFQPRGTPHGFRVEGDGPARILYMTVPAGFDQLVLQGVSSTRNLKLTAVARHKIEILGPLPE